MVTETEATQHLKKLIQDIEDLKIVKARYEAQNKEYFEGVVQKDLLAKELSDLEDDILTAKARLREVNIEFSTRQQQLLNVKKKLLDIKASIDG